MIEPIISTTIADRVADQLRQDILQKKIPEGSRITVKEISERYGVGLSPVRDAFQVLKSERLLEIIPYKHAKVLNLDRSFIEKAYEYVACLESFMAIRLAASPHPEAIERLCEINEAIKEQLAEKPVNIKNFLKLNAKFHNVFTELEKNDIVTEQYRFYSENILTATRATYSPGEKRLLQVCREHDAIIDCLKNRDAEQLSKLVYEHSNNAKEDFMVQK